MSFFDDASLVMIPSGYKTSKVYSVKPTDGSGDLAFTRSNDTATRVGPDGLIEKVRTNVSFYSEQFDNGFWTKLGTALTVTANTTIAPNGTLTADTLNVSNNDNVLYGSRATALAGNEFTFSIYVKGSGTFSMNIRLNSVTTTTETKTLTSDWQRFSVSVTNTVPVTAVEFYLGLNTSSTYNVWGAQVESGPVATPYIATTTAAVSVGPVANVPRLDYLNSSCPKLLLEPQRTNLAQFSESFNNAYWVKSNATITANTTVSPDGTQNADTAVITAGGYVYAEFISYAAVTGQSATLSVFAKNATSTLLAFGGATTAGTDVYKIENYGNGWYRHSVVRTFTATATTTLQFIINLVGTSILWGAQVEGSNSAYATSYIPTLGASVTRGADAASKTGISSLIGQTEGTLFAEFTRLNVGNAVVMFQCNDGTTNNRAQLEIGATGIATTSVLSGGAVSCVITGATLALGQTHKLALTYKANDFKLYVNGVLAGTDTSGAVPISMSRIDLASELGTSFGGVSISQILNFTTALTNAQAIELTA